MSTRLSENTTRSRAGNIPFFNPDYSSRLKKSDSDSDSLTPTQSSNRKRVRGPAMEWKFVKVFETAEEVDAIIKSDKWSLYYHGRNSEGRYSVYRCSQSKQKLSDSRFKDQIRRKKAKIAQLEEIENYDPTDGENYDNHEICKCAVKLLYRADSTKVIYSESNHEHTNHNKKVTGISLKMTEKILELYELGVTKPSSIKMTLRSLDLDEEIPTRRQLYYELVKIKLKKFGIVNIKMSQLNQWLLEHSCVPDDENMPFVIKFESGSNSLFAPIVNLNEEDDNEKENDEDEDEDHQTAIYFRFMVSTASLLKLAINCSYVCTDATYKLIWFGFPVLMIGTTDPNRQFHPFGMAVSTNECAQDFKFIFESVKDAVKSIHNETFRPTMLQADAAQSITNGFKACFSYDDTDFTRLNCWAHVDKKLRSKLLIIKDKNIRSDLYENICVLQLANNRVTFDYLTKLFFKKWCTGTVKVIEFLDYMKKNWIEKNCNWFEGAAPSHPSTNNALESTNNDIKNSFTFRERLPMNEFLQLVLKIVNKWSEDRNGKSNKQPDVSIFKSVPISKALEAESFKFATEKITVHEENGRFYFNYDNGTKITLTNIKNYQKGVEQNGCKKFDDYSALISSICIVSIDKINWKDSYCLCSAFHKTYMCVHVLGLCMRLGIVEASSEAIDLAMGKKKKRGPKSKAKGGKALIIE